ncbi:hypothetical protein ISCGN_024053 [Ixodes scapularis]
MKLTSDVTRAINDVKKVTSNVTRVTCDVTRATSDATNITRDTMNDVTRVTCDVKRVTSDVTRPLGIRRGWIDFPKTTGKRDDVERGFQRVGRIPGVIGCVDGTMIAIVGPSQNDPTVTKAAYWCRKQFYALNVMGVCDADCRVMSLDTRYPGSVHDSFAWRYSWLRSNFEQGRLIDDGKLLLISILYFSEPVTAVPPRSPTQATMAVAPTRDTTSAKKSVATTEVPAIRDTIGDREPLIVLATIRCVKISQKCKQVIANVYASSRTCFPETSVREVLETVSNDTGVSGKVASPKRRPRNLKVPSTRTVL